MSVITVVLQEIHYSLCILHLTGSLLVGRTQEETYMLKKRVKQLNESGLRAEYLSASSLQSKEPALEIGKEGGAAFVPDDCQLDASQTVAFIEEVN